MAVLSSGEGMGIVWPAPSESGPGSLRSGGRPGRRRRFRAGSRSGTARRRNWLRGAWPRRGGGRPGRRPASLVGEPEGPAAEGEHPAEVVADHRDGTGGPGERRPGEVDLDRIGVRPGPDERPAVGDEGDRGDVLARSRQPGQARRGGRPRPGRRSRRRSGGSWAGPRPRRGTSRRCRSRGRRPTDRPRLRGESRSDRPGRRRGEPVPGHPNTGTAGTRRSSGNGSGNPLRR